MNTNTKTDIENALDNFNVLKGNNKQTLKEQLIKEKELSAREAAQRKMKESDKKYRSLFEQASDPILVSDFDGNFTDVNGSFCKLFGYTKKELLRMNIRSM